MDRYCQPVCFEYQPSVLAGTTFRHRGWSAEEEVTLRYPREGVHCGLEEASGAAIARHPHSPRVCFPSGPFCFSSISDLPTPAYVHVCHAHPCLPSTLSTLLSFGYPRQQTPDNFSRLSLRRLARASSTPVARLKAPCATLTTFLRLKSRLPSNFVSPRCRGS